MTNPLLLPTHQKHCPSDCPFLGMRTFLPGILPFYCNKYEIFLGVSVTKQTLRCAACLGQECDIIQAGLSFIESYTENKVAAIFDTKQAFLELGHTYQKLFVDLISKTGAQIALPYGTPVQADYLLDQIFLSWNAYQNKVGSPEAQAFKTLLSETASGISFFTRETQTLLMNLFQVLDHSEKEMLQNILQNQNQISSFLEQFTKTPQDHDLLRNTRALLYAYDDLSCCKKNQQQYDQMLSRVRMNIFQNGFQR